MRNTKAKLMTNAISAQGLALIQELEGFQAEPKQLPTGGWVVGYSHVRATEPGEAVNENDAVELLTGDLAAFESLVNTQVTQPLTQTQFDALVSFAFSVGAEAFGRSQVLRRVNAGDYVSAACAMDAWRKSDVSGELVIIDALVRRRTAEKALFLKELPRVSAPSVFVRPQLDHAASILGAPVTYVATPEVGSIAPAPAKPEPTERLTEILKSEPATEALLLTQVVAPEAVEDDGEIFTAHAKPVARYDFEPRIAPRRSEKPKPEKQNWFNRVKPAVPTGADQRLHNMRKLATLKLPTFENLGLAALMLFGLGLLATAVSLLISNTGDVAEYAGAAALGAPGIAAVLMSAFGLWRAPRVKPVSVEG
ncbi:MAG: lysozyme [Alphaproteobacteria bacterium]|nr:lysozyme [Alphaproteobacteria bacterium]